MAICAHVTLGGCKGKALNRQLHLVRGPCLRLRSFKDGNEWWRSPSSGYCPNRGKENETGKIRLAHSYAFWVMASRGVFIASGSCLIIFISTHDSGNKSVELFGTWRGRKWPDLWIPRNQEFPTFNNFLAMNIIPLLWTLTHRKQRLSFLSSASRNNNIPLGSIVIHTREIIKLSHGAPSEEVIISPFKSN